MENGNVSLKIEILKIDMEVAVSYCFPTFCAAASEVMMIKNKRMNVL